MPIAHPQFVNYDKTYGNTWYSHLAVVKRLLFPPARRLVDELGLHIYESGPPDWLLKAVQQGRSPVEPSDGG